MYFYNFCKSATVTTVTDQSISIIIGMLTPSSHLALSVALNISLVSLFLVFTTRLLATFLFCGTLYNEMRYAKGKEIIASGWRAAGITDVIRLGTKELPPIDPFHDIDPLIFETEESNQLQSICNLSIEERKIGYSRSEDVDFDSDDEFELHNRGALDAFTDFNKE